jgi:hypothetical protein
MIIGEQELRRKMKTFYSEMLKHDILGLISNGADEPSPIPSSVVKIGINKISIHELISISEPWAEMVCESDGYLTILFQDKDFNLYALTKAPNNNIDIPEENS